MEPTAKPAHAPQPPKAALPRGRVMFCYQTKHPNGKPGPLYVSHKFQHVIHGGPCVSCAVTPAGSQREAAAIVRWHAMSHQEQIKALACAMYARWTPDSNGKHYCGRNAEDAEACLAVMKTAPRRAKK